MWYWEAWWQSPNPNESSLLAVDNNGSTKRLKADVNWSLMTSIPAYDLLMDDTSTVNMIYVWEAVIWTPLNAPSWRIKRINQTTWTIIWWANSVNTFTNIWNNRTTLTYSL